VEDSVDVLPYSLPDAGLAQGAGSDGTGLSCLVFIPTTTAVVIGKSNRTEEELHAEAIRADAIPVLRRPSGGHAVLLTPRTAVVAIAAAGRPELKPRKHFRRFSRILTAALARLGVDGVVEAGTSDLAIGNKKFLGSSLYLSSRAAFFHAVVNLAEEPAVIARYLKIPPRQPDYRLGRSHEEFVTSLALEGYSITAAGLERTLREILARMERKEL
jgi:lipoate-protein ligase A